MRVRVGAAVWDVHYWQAASVTAAMGSWPFVSHCTGGPVAGVPAAGQEVPGRDFGGP